MGRSFSATTGKNVVWGGLNGVVRGEFQRTAGLNATVRGEFLKTAGLVGDVSLYAVYEKLAGLNAYVSPPSTLLNGLLGYWKLDGSSTDSLGLHNGTDTAMTYTAGKVGAGGTFNGSTSVITMAAGISLDSNNWSIACWHRPASVAGFSRFFSYYGNGPTLQQNGTQIRVVHAGIVDFTPTGFTVSTGVWSHMVFTRSGTTFAAYKDGVLIQSVTASPTYTADTSVRLGNSAYVNEPYNGSLDEAAIWNRALTAAEVDELYNRSVGNPWGFGNSAPLTTSLLGYWKLDGNSMDSLGVANGTDTAITYSAGNGKIIQGAGFNGSTSQIDAGSVLPLDSSNWTLAVWMNPTSAAVGRFLTYYGSGPTLQWSAGNVALIHAGTVDWNPGIPVTAGVWTHLVLSRRGSQIIAYKNGSQIAINSSFAASYSKDSTIRFGNSPYFSEPFDGKLDEIGIWSRGLDATEVAALYNGGSGVQYSFGTAPAKTTGLAGYWKLDGDSNDSLGISNGSDTGIVYSSGKINQAAGFLPASLSLINAGTNPRLEVQGDSFTLAAWINLTASTQDYQSWILRATAATKPQYRFGMRLQTTEWGLSFWNGSVYRDYWVTTSAMPTATWVHVAVVHRKEALTYTFYKNGVQVDVKTAVNRDFVSGAGTFYMGRNVENNSYWNGAIDEVGVWNRALLPEDITALYNAGAGIQYPF